MELKPCPFCGAPVTVWETDFGIVRVIECKNCKTRFVFQWHETGMKLFDHWNRRME